MGVIIRQSLKATFVSYVGAVIGAFSVIFLYPYCLSPEQIGLTRVLLESATIFSFFAQLGMSNAAIRYFPFFANRDKNDHGFLFFLVSVPFLGFIIFSLVFVLFMPQLVGIFQEKSGLLTQFFIMVLPLTLFTMYTTIFESYSSLLQRIVVPKLIREIIVRILIISIVLMLYFKILLLSGFVTWYVLIYGIAMVLLIFYTHKLRPLNFKPDFAFIDKVMGRKIGLFMGFMILGGLGSSIASRIDVYMISSKISLADTGIFSIAFFICAFIEMPSRSVYQISNPIAADALKRNDFEMLGILYKKVSINQLLISGFIFLMIWINIDNIFSIMPHGDIYRKGKFVVLLIGLAKVFDSVTGINGSIMNNSKYYYYTLVFLLFLSVLAVVNNLIFIPLFGITGSAMATATSIFVYNTALILFVWWKLKLQPFTRQTLVAVGLISGVFLLNYLIVPIHNPYIDSIVRSAILSVILAAGIYFLRISPDINQTLHSLIRSIGLRKKE